MYSTIKILLFAFIALVILSNCTKQQDGGQPTDPVDTTIYIPVINFGNGSFRKNGSLWTYSFEAWEYKSDSSFQIRSEINGNIAEYFSIRDIPLLKGKYELEFRTVINGLNNIPEPLFSYYVDGDQPGGSYNLDTIRSDHFLEILHVDTLARTVEGRFQIFLRLKPRNYNLPGLPDTLSITDGRFYLPVRKP